MSIPKDLKYSKDHEWIRDNGDGSVTIGITHNAQEQLGDVVYVELPDVGAQVEQGGSFGTVESVKAVSDLFAPVDGEVAEANEALADAPETVNSDPYGEAWMVKVTLSDTSQLDALMSPEDYEALVNEG